MDKEKMNKKLKKKGKIFQVIGINKSMSADSLVFATRKDAEKFVEQQSYLNQVHIVDIDVWSVKN